MARATILLAENDRDFGITRAELLERQGYRVILAVSPTEAQRMLEEGGIDVVILDLRLTDDEDERDTSGLTLAKEVDPSIPKIFLTGFPSVDVAREALRAQQDGFPLFVDFLSKYEGLEAMLASVQHALDHPPPLPVHVHLERDYEEARKQAIFIHRVRLALIIVGSIVIIAGAIGVVLGQVATGVLGIMSGVVVEALAGFFSKLSEDANKRMDRYHRELLKLYKESK